MKKWRGVILLYCFSQNRIEFTLCDKTKKNINNKYLRLYNYLVNKNIYYEYSDDNTKIYKLNNLETAMSALEIEFKYLNNIFVGELNNEEKSEIKNNTQNLIDKIINSTIKTKGIMDGLNSTNILNITKKRKYTVLKSRKTVFKSVPKTIYKSKSRKTVFKSVQKSRKL